jgi:hypothetical protein
VSFPLKYLGQWEAACQWSIAYIALEGDTNGILGTWGWLSTLGPSADSNCKIYWFETDTSLMRIWCHCMSLQPVFKLGSPEMIWNASILCKNNWQKGVSHGIPNSEMSWKSEGNTGFSIVRCTHVIFAHRYAPGFPALTLRMTAVGLWQSAGAGSS